MALSLVPRLLLLVLALLHTPSLAPAACPSAPSPAPPTADINTLLDAWHQAAARADEAAYFACFSPSAIFMGTDATERWNLDQFRAFAHPYFAKGKAWSFTPRDRHIQFSTDQKTAWFDEMLDTTNLGECRGSGVVELLGSSWKISQYNLSIPIPNDIADSFVSKIAQYKAQESPVWPARDPSIATELRIITFNIRYANTGDGDNQWSNRKASVAAFLKSQDPDLICLQEALRSQLDDLRAALPEFSELGVGRDDGKTKGEYSAILYRADQLNAANSGTFWFSDEPDKPGSKSWGNHITRICTWAKFAFRDTPSRRFTVYNLHLDHESQPSREKSVTLLLDRISRGGLDDPVIVTGDFNAGEDNAAVQAMKGEKPAAVVDSLKSQPPPERQVGPLVDTFRVLHPDEKIVGTFNNFKGEKKGPKIDYIFTQARTRPLESTIFRNTANGRPLSDHFAVGARLEIPGSNP